MCLTYWQTLKSVYMPITRYCFVLALLMYNWFWHTMLKSWILMNTSKQISWLWILKKRNVLYLAVGMSQMEYSRSQLIWIIWKLPAHNRIAFCVNFYRSEAKWSMLFPNLHNVSRVKPERAMEHLFCSSCTHLKGVCQAESPFRDHSTWVDEIELLSWSLLSSTLWFTFSVQEFYGYMSMYCYLGYLLTLVIPARYIISLFKSLYHLYVWCVLCGDLCCLCLYAHGNIQNTGIAFMWHLLLPTHLFSR